MLGAVVPIELPLEVLVPLGLAPIPLEPDALEPVLLRGSRPAGQSPDGLDGLATAPALAVSSAAADVAGAQSLAAVPIELEPVVLLLGLVVELV